MKEIKIWLLFWIVLTALNFWCSFLGTGIVVIGNRLALVLSAFALGATVEELIEN